MSTPTTLSLPGGPLIPFEFDPDSRALPVRQLYLTRGLDLWLSEILPAEAPDDPDNLPPDEQVAGIMWAYCAGKPLAYGVDRKVLEPIGQYIWELRTCDVRIFGWFYRRRVFIATIGELKRRLSSNTPGETFRLYKPFIDATRLMRNQVGLDVPLFIRGISANDVL